jgi:dCMP deaminase
MMLEVASVVAKRSTCSRLAVGAVLALDGRILGTGYNGAPRGLPHCVHVIDESCTWAVHAEVNVIASAAYNGAASKDATLYVTHAPCVNCSALLVNAGIGRVLYGHAYRNDEGVTLLRRVGIKVEELA